MCAAPDRMETGDMSEFELISRLFAPLAKSGGAALDCQMTSAVLEPPELSCRLS